MKQEMKIRVLLTDIFDHKAPTVMDRRIEHSFGADGQDFWQKFFPCDKVHPDDKILYLFTEYQMRELYNWWAAKYKESSEKIRKNLDFSRQNFFQDAVLIPNRKYIGIIYARNVKHGSGKRFEVSRVFFGMPPNFTRKKYIDFFDGRFNEDTPSVFKDDECNNILTELSSMRSAIEKEFGVPKKNDKKWLCYLGSGIIEKDHASIEYHSEINGCPFANNIDFSLMA